MSINKPSVHAVMLYYSVFIKLYTAEMMIKKYEFTLLSDLP